MRAPYTRRVVPDAHTGKDPLKSFKTLTELEEALAVLFKQPKVTPGFDRDSMLYQQGKVDLAEQIAERIRTITNNQLSPDDEEEDDVS